MSEASIWSNHEEWYPIPVGFEDTTYYNDATPKYTGLGGRCQVWMHDEATQKDVWGDSNYRPLFTVDYHPTKDVWELTDADEGFMSVGLDNWQNVLQLIELCKLGRGPLETNDD